VTVVFVADWPPLNPFRLLAPGAHTPPPAFPFDAPHQTYAYVARNLIFHLFRALPLPPGATVLMPEYHSGVEVWAVRAAGLPVSFYPVNRRFEPDLDAVRRLARETPARVLYVIHFAGWPQPLAGLTAIAREHDLLLFEDCALALFSRDGAQPLGTTGDYACFCLYKTLPVPNGGLLVQRGAPVPALDAVAWRPGSTTSVAGRTADIVIDWIRGRSDPVGASLARLKRAAGRALNAGGVARLPVGDISPEYASCGFQIDAMDVGMSRLCHRLIARCQADELRAARRRNFVALEASLQGHVRFVRDDFPDGMCPLFAPILVDRKVAVIEALRRRGVGAVGFWNYGHPEAESQMSPDTRFLRDHVVELPIHQELTRTHIAYMARQVIAATGGRRAMVSV
jgi:dTDP-4-amino-4,6-dideoxygalactose transaminase